MIRNMDSGQTLGKFPFSFGKPRFYASSITGNRCFPWFLRDYKADSPTRRTTALATITFITCKCVYSTMDPGTAGWLMLCLDIGAVILGVVLHRWTQEKNKEGAREVFVEEWKGDLGKSVRKDTANHVVHRLKSEQGAQSAAEKKIDELIKMMGPAKADDVRLMMKKEMRRARKSLEKEFARQADIMTEKVLESSKGKLNRLLQDEVRARLENDEKELKEVAEAYAQDTLGVSPGDYARALGYEKIGAVIDMGNTYLLRHPEAAERYLGVRTNAEK